MSEKESVVRAVRGEPVKKLVVVRSAHEGGEDIASPVVTEILTLQVLQQISYRLPLVLQE